MLTLCSFTSLRFHLRDCLLGRLALKGKDKQLGPNLRTPEVLWKITAILLRVLGYVPAALLGTLCTLISASPGLLSKANGEDMSGHT